MDAMREQADYQDPSWLRGQVSSILNFWYPAARDDRHGGFLNLLAKDGSVIDGEQKHLVASCRFAVLFSMGILADTGLDWCHDAAKDAVDFLRRAHRDPVHGGYFWILKGDVPVDRRKQGYGHSFVLLAGATATRAGVPGGPELLEDAVDIAERHMFRGEALAINTASEDFSEVTPYRSQNPNMHYCEAFIAAHEATGDNRYLDRAYRIAERVASQLATAAGGYVWENYDAGWQPDWDRRDRDRVSLESTIGMMPGHQLEWAKLLGILARYRSDDWMLPQARHLYRVGWDYGWDRSKGGFYTGLNRNLTIADATPSYWSTSEAIGAAAVLGETTRESSYWNDYAVAWDHARSHLIDAEHGGWFKIPALNKDRTDTRKGDGLDPDYHPCGACLEAIRSIDLMTKSREIEQL
jgi:mannose/cellobiose epimerase-like protein (N-acyl-D-glucosamine 2-epimerase family)